MTHRSSSNPNVSRRRFMIGAAGFTFAVASGLPFGAPLQTRQLAAM